jgi:DNA-binding IclR family transcriptional regulator
MSKRNIKTTKTIFDIIESIQKLGGPGVSEIAEYNEIAVSTAHTHLSTLVEMEYLRKEGDCYYLGLRFLDHGVYAKNQHPLNNAIQPALGQLAEDTGESAWVVVEEHGWGINLEGAKGDRGVRTEERMGYRTFLHVHAPGKAILAHLPDEYVETILEKRGLPRLTENTITDRDVLFSELEEIHDRGYAFDNGEGIQGVSAVAAPIITDNTVRGAVTVYGPSNRFTNAKFHEEYPEAVLGTANTIELQLTYDR